MSDLLLHPQPVHLVKAWFSVSLEHLGTLPQQFPFPCLSGSSSWLQGLSNGYYTHLPDLTVFPPSSTFIGSPPGCLICFPFPWCSFSLSFADVPSTEPQTNAWRISLPPSSSPRMMVAMWANTGLASISGPSSSLNPQSYPLTRIHPYSGGTGVGVGAIFLSKKSFFARLQCLTEIGIHWTPSTGVH